MRLDIAIDDRLVERIDEEVGQRYRSSFIELAVRKALDERSIKRRPAATDE
jgi:metal-responsive CopG/Arc/MetJ family transcriptional regulator